jgi:hypothetical protein
MVDRVNGAVRQGFYFSGNVRSLQVTVTGGTFLADLTVAGTADVVNSGLEQVLEAIATRGSIIAVSVASATVVHVLVDYAQAFDDAAVVTEVQGLIDAIATPNLSASAIVVANGFAAAAQGAAA